MATATRSATRRKPLACIFAATLLLGLLCTVGDPPPLRRAVDSVLLRSIIGSAWVDRGKAELRDESARFAPDRLAPAVWRREYPPTNVTILAFVNSKYMAWVDHLLHNLAALGISKYALLVAEDRECLAALRHRGVRAQLAAGESDGRGPKQPPQLPSASASSSPPPQQAAGDAVAFRSSAYKALVHKMPRQVLRLLRSGRSVLLLDADVTLLGNPLEYLAPLGRDLYVQDDFREMRARLNGGLFFARATPAARRLFEDMLAYIEQHPDTYNQPAFNWALLRNRARLRIKALSPVYFANGAAMFDERRPIQNARVLPVAVHHNWGEPQAYKLQRARDAGLLVQRPDLASLLANFSARAYGLDPRTH